MLAAVDFSTTTTSVSRSQFLNPQSPPTRKDSPPKLAADSSTPKRTAPHGTIDRPDAQRRNRNPSPPKVPTDLRATRGCSPADGLILSKDERSLAHKLLR